MGTLSGNDYLCGLYKDTSKVFDDKGQYYNKQEAKDMDPNVGYTLIVITDGKILMASPFWCQASSFIHAYHHQCSRIIEVHNQQLEVPTL